MTKPIVVGSTYFLESEIRFKIFLSIAGSGVTGQAPFVTLIRDADNSALNFTLGVFEPITPATIGNSQYRDTMTELGNGSYYYPFDPTAFDGVDAGSYTVLFENTAPGLQAASQFEFLYTANFANETSFGFVDRDKNVCINEDIMIAYKAPTGQSQVFLDVYDPFDQLVVSKATMSELGSTGIYKFEFNPSLAGEYLFLGSDGAAGSSDAMMITVGGTAEKVKEIQASLAQVLQNPPSVNPC